MRMTWKRIEGEAQRRNRNPREEPLHDETDQITQAGGAHGDAKELCTGNQHGLAGEMAFEGADAETG